MDITRRDFIKASAVTAAATAAGFGMPEAGAQTAAKRPMEIADLFRFVRIADPQLSPDGTLVAWQAATVIQESNGSSSSLWIAPADGSQAPRALTTVAGTTKDARPRWSPRGWHCAR